MSKLTNSKKKDIAERLFVNDGMTAKAIAEQLDVAEQTIGRWNKAGNWNNRRAELLSSPHKLKEILTKELQKIAEGEKSSIDADALSKIGKVIENMSGKVSVQIVLSVFKEFDNWMAEQEAETAIGFLEWHKKFILYKATIDG